MDWELGGPTPRLTLVTTEAWHMRLLQLGGVQPATCQGVVQPVRVHHAPGFTTHHSGHTVCTDAIGVPYSCHDAAANGS